MSKEVVNIRIELDRREDADLRQWAKQAERSKRLQARHILRKVIGAWKDNPDTLKHIGIAQ